MQLVNFDNTCESIEAVCSKVNHQIRYDKTFLPESRIEFEQTLKQLFHMLNKDSYYFCQQNLLWHTAYRIVRLTKLSHKMEKILQNIQGLAGPKYFSKKIRSQVLPSLAYRVSELNQFAFCNYRLPFNPGTAHMKFYEIAKQKLRVIHTSNINSIERDFFHLLGDHLSKEQLAQVDIKALTGSWEIYSLLSLGNILKVAIEEEKNDQDKRTYKFLLTKITDALVLSTKLSFVLPYNKNGKVTTNFPDKAYYEALVGLQADETVQLKPPKMSAHAFLGKYNLDNVSSVPMSLIENDMAWDMEETIARMKVGDVNIFLLGSLGHRVIIQLTRTDEGLANQMPQFTYEIFNTGDGVYPFHNIFALNNEAFAYPITYVDVPLSALNFVFCSDMITHSLYSSSMPIFYDKHHYYLTQIGGAKKICNVGQLYPIQTYGTCCYAGLEAWMNSYLTSQQSNTLELIKTRLLTEKQSQIVTLLESDILRSGSRGEIVQSPVTFQYLVFKDKQKKLEESRLLLELGIKYLHNLQENTPHE